MSNILGKILKLIGCLALAVIGFFAIQLLIRLIGELVQAQPPTSCSWLCDFIAKLSGINCMECEMLAFRSLWLWIILFGLLILGIILLLIRCLWGIFFGDKKDEDKQPSVAVHGQGYLVCTDESAGIGSPVVTYTAEGSPAGGSYEWSVISGNDKVSLQSGLNQSVLRVKASAPSQAVQDITLQVKYTTDKGSATGSIKLTAHKPASSVRLSSQTQQFNGPQTYGYVITYKYRVLDQFGNAFPEQIVNLTETLNPFNNPFGTPFISRNFITDNNAEYFDDYGITYQNQPVPTNYIAEVRQQVFAEGFKVLDHIVVYGPSNVSFR